MKQRWPELDVWRGITVVAMIVYHLFLFSTFHSTGNFFSVSPSLRAIVLLIPISFLTLVGIGLELKYRSLTTEQFPGQVLRRVVMLSLIAAGISLVTWFVFPQMPVYFGIIHLILVGSLIGAWVVWSQAPSSLLIGVSLMIIGNGVVFGEISMNSWWLMPLGIKPNTFITLDYFPIFPWLGVILLGAVVGRWLYPQGKRRTRFFTTFSDRALWLQWMGRHALWLYLLHFPIIWLTLLLIDLL